MLDIAVNQQQQLTSTGRRMIGIKRSSEPTASRQHAASKILQHSSTTSLSASKSRPAAVASPAGIISNGATSESRLKLSTITRVPSAKSRLKQPVASLCSSPLSPTISNGRSSTTSESPSSASHENQSPQQSVLTRRAPLVSKKTSIDQPASTTDDGATQRPRSSISSSTSSNSSRSRLIAPTTRAAKSVLPRLVKKPQSSKNEISSSLSSKQSPLAPNGNTAKSARLSSLHKQPVAASKTPVAKVPTSHGATKVGATASSKYMIKSNHATPCAAPKVSPCGRPASNHCSTGDQQQHQRRQPPTSNSGSENCLGGRLNNLVAVVHPQQQQHQQNDDELRVAGQAKQLLGKHQEQKCSSNTATTAITSTTTINSTAQDSKDVVQAEREGSKGGIVNLNHKDVNGATTAGPEEEAKTTTTITTRRNENDGPSSSSSVNDLENHRANEEAPLQPPSRGKKEARSTVATTIGGDHEVENTSRESKQDGTAAESDTAAAATTTTTIKQRLMGITTSGQGRASSPADNSNNKTRAHRHPPTSDHACAAVSNGGTLATAPSSSLSAQSFSSSSSSSLSGNKFDVANSLSSFEQIASAGICRRQIAFDKFQTTGATADESSRNHDGSQRDQAAGHEQLEQINVRSHSHNSAPSSNSSGLGGMPAALDGLAAASNVGDCYKSHRDQQPGGINLQQRRARPSALKPTRDTRQVIAGGGGGPASRLSCLMSENKNDRHLATKPPPPPQQPPPQLSPPMKVTSSSSAHKHAALGHDNHRQHSSINDRLLRKPMGQQVLSLMMLDAGLLPATGNQQTTPSEESESHVCLQSEPVGGSERRLEFLPSSSSSSPCSTHNRNCAGETYDSNNNDAYLASDNSETTNVFKPNARSLAFAATNGHDSLASVCANLTSDGSATHGAKLKQIRSSAARTVNHDFSCTTTNGASITSISLPCSPRLERASRLDRARRHGAMEGSQRKLEGALRDKLYHLDMGSHPFNGSSGGSYQRATARWLSPATGGGPTSGSQSPRRYGSPVGSSSGAAGVLTSSHLYCETTNQTLETHHSSLASSSCSSLTNNHCPPMLALSNQLDAREFHELIRANVDESVRRMKQEQQAQQRFGRGVHASPNESITSPGELGSQSTDVATRKLKLDTRAGQSQWGPHGNRACDEQTNLSSAIDLLDWPADRAAELAAAATPAERQQRRSASRSNCESEQEKSRSNNIGRVETNEGIHSSDGGDLPASSAAAETQHFELQSRRQQQPRSNSIGGQEFHHFNGAEHHQHHRQRLKQSLLGQSHLQQNPYIDPSQYYDRRQLGFNGNLTPSQQYQTGLPADPRSISPSYSLAGGRPSDIYVPKRSASIKYPLDRQHRTNLHASLECLNTTYSEYGQSPNQKQQHLSAAYHLARQQQYAAHQQMQQHQPFQQQPPIQNPHYAASYVMAAAPAETVVNQNGGQDLAAADMGAPPAQLQQPLHYPVISLASNGTSAQQQQQHLQQNNTSYQIQNLFHSRPSLQMSQSPLHRRVGAGVQASQMGAQNGGSTNPMRAGHSSLSLASSAYLIEDKLQSEIKQLSGELKSEKEKNEALNNQLTINSSLMAAFEQSLTTLNNRLRQMSTINERKDQEIDELRSQLGEVGSKCLTVVARPNSTSEKSTSPVCGAGLSVTNFTNEREFSTLPQVSTNDDEHDTNRKQSPAISSSPVYGDQDQRSEKDLKLVIEDLRRQLVVKERLLTETRLEALSAASKLEELESRLNGEHSLLVNEDDLDEGVMVANHSPSDSDAITDSAHFSEMNSHQQQQINSNHNNNKQSHSQRNSNNIEDMILFTPTHSIASNQNAGNHDSHPGANSTSGRVSNNSADDTNEMIHLHRQLQKQQHDNQSNHSSSDYHVEEDKSPGDTSAVNQQQQHQQREFDSEDQRQEASRGQSRDSDTMNKLLSGLLVDN